MTILMRALQQLRRRKARQDLAEFASLIDAPGNLATGVVLPANAHLRASVAALLAAPTVVIDVSGGREIGLPAGASGKVSRVGYFEASRTITKAAGAPATVSVYVEDGFGTLYKIAEG